MYLQLINVKVLINKQSKNIKYPVIIRSFPFDQAYKLDRGPR